MPASFFLVTETIMPQKSARFKYEAGSYSLKSSAVNLGSVGTDFGSLFNGSYTYFLQRVLTDNVPSWHTKFPSLFFDEN